MNASSPQALPAKRRRGQIFLIVAVIIFWIFASRLTVAWSERFYLIVPWIAFTQAVIAIAAAGWRRSIRRLVIIFGALVVLGIVSVYDVSHPDSGWPALERTICLYGLLSLMIVCSWWWMIIGQPIYRVLLKNGQASTARRIVSRTAAIMVYTIILYAYLFSFLQTHWPKRIGPMSPHRLRLDTDDIAWHSHDGTRLAGWFVRAVNSDRTAVVCHGVAADKSDMIDFIVALNAAGYNVLAFDFRGHGQSGGHTVSFAAHERDDIRSAIDMLGQRYPRHCKRMVGVGWSMGAASLILAAAEDQRLEALHVDAVYAETFAIARVIAAQAPPVIRQISLYGSTALASLESGANLFTLSPADAAARVSPRPMMFVHGDQDPIIPIEQGCITFESAQEPKSWHVVEGAGHCQTIAVASGRYERRMIAFLNEALGIARR